MNPTVLSILVFGLTALGLITLYETVFGRQSGLGDPLSQEQQPTASARAAPANRLVQWRLQRLRETQAKTPGEQSLPDVLTHAGFRGLESVARFQLVRVAIMTGAAMIGAAACGLAGKPWVLGAAAGLTLGYIIPTVAVSRFARARQSRMTHELPDILALLVVSLEAGIGVAETLRLVGRETQRQGRLLGRELSVTSAQMAAGMSFEDTLKDLGTRTGIDEIKSLAALLIQSEKIGARLAPALRASADLLNSRRRMSAEEAARKTSIKMLVPLVFLILPAMLLVILGPAVIQLIAVFTAARH